MGLKIGAHGEVSTVAMGVNRPNCMRRQLRVSSVCMRTFRVPVQALRKRAAACKRHRKRWWGLTGCPTEKLSCSGSTGVLLWFASILLVRDPPCQSFLNMSPIYIV